MLCSEGENSGQCAGSQATLVGVGQCLDPQPVQVPLLLHPGPPTHQYGKSAGSPAGHSLHSLSSCGLVVLQLSLGCPTETSSRVMTQHQMRRRQPAQTHLPAPTAAYNPIPKQIPYSGGSQGFSVLGAFIAFILFFLSALGQKKYQTIPLIKWLDPNN